MAWAAHRSAGYPGASFIILLRRLTKGGSGRGIGAYRGLTPTAAIDFQPGGRVNHLTAAASHWPEGG